MNLSKLGMPRPLTPLGGASLYASVSTLWIIVFDYLLSFLVGDPVLMERIDIAKDMIFVAVTSGLLYLLLRIRGATGLPDGGDAPIAARRLSLIFVALVLAVPLVGYAITRLYQPQIEREAYADLQVIAQLKAEQIENWLQERNADCELLVDDEALAARVDQLEKHAQSVEATRSILDHFDRLIAHYHYSRILLLDSGGGVLLTAGGDVQTTHVPESVLRQALASQQVQRRSIYRDEEGHIHLDWVVPLDVKDAHGRRTLGGIVLRVTAQQFIYPLIQRWPTVSPSGETLLVRRDEASVLYLNQLRHRDYDPMTFRLPLTTPQLPSATAIRDNRPGVTAGVDYRGVAVLAAYRPVAGTDWHIVAKIDRDEVLAPLRDLVLWISLVTLVAIVAVGAAVLLLWRQQQRAHHLEVKSRSLAAIEKSERHFHSLFENMLEGYMHGKMLFRDGVAEEFVYLEVNPAFETLSGLKDVVGKRASEVTPGIRESNAELFEAYRRVALSGQPQHLETYLAGLDRWFSISVYCPEQGEFVAIFDNITARKRSEQVLAESEQRFRGVVEQTLAGIYIIQDGRFVYVNPRFAEIFGYASASELAGIDPASLVAEPDRALVAENIRRSIENGQPGLTYSFVGVRKDGSLIDVGVHGARATHLGRPAVIGLMQDVSEKKRAEEQIRRYVAQLEKSFMQTIEVATLLIEKRDPYTAGHEKRVAQIAVALGAEMGLDAQRIEGLRVGGYIHDIGKIAVPVEILTKPGRLSEIEYELIKEHPQAGYDILKNVDFPWPVAEIAYQHHERMDGSGYPRGLKGEEILLEARITAVADVVEAMSAHRPYRAGLGLEKALEEIERGSGTLYDPVAAAACLRLFRDKGYELPVRENN